MPFVSNIYIYIEISAVHQSLRVHPIVFDLVLVLYLSLQPFNRYVTENIKKHQETLIDIIIYKLFTKYK